MSTGAEQQRRRGITYILSGNKEFKTRCQWCERWWVMWRQVTGAERFAQMLKERYVCPDCRGYVAFKMEPLEKENIDATEIAGGEAQDAGTENRGRAGKGHPQQTDGEVPEAGRAQTKGGGRSEEDE